MATAPPAVAVAPPLTPSASKAASLKGSSSSSKATGSKKGTGSSKGTGWTTSCGGLVVGTTLGTGAVLGACATGGTCAATGGTCVAGGLIPELGAGGGNTACGVGTRGSVAAAKLTALMLPIAPPSVLTLTLPSDRSLGPSSETAISSVPLAALSSVAGSSATSVLPTLVIYGALEPCSPGLKRFCQAQKPTKASKSRTTRTATILLSAYMPRPGPWPPCIRLLSTPLSALSASRSLGDP